MPRWTTLPRRRAPEGCADRRLRDRLRHRGPFAFFFRSARARTTRRTTSRWSRSRARLRRRRPTSSRSGHRRRRCADLRARRRRRVRDEPGDVRVRRVAPGADWMCSPRWGPAPRPPVSRSTTSALGPARWARPLIDIVFDGVADTIEFELATLAATTPPAGRTGYPRTPSRRQPRRPARPRGRAERLIPERTRDIDALCERNHRIAQAGDLRWRSLMPERHFVKYTFLKVDPAWRRLDPPPSAPPTSAISSPPARTSPRPALRASAHRDAGDAT